MFTGEKIQASSLTESDKGRLQAPRQSHIPSTVCERRQEDWEEKHLKAARFGDLSTIMKALLEQVICQMQKKRTDKTS